MIREPFPVRSKPPQKTIKKVEDYEWEQIIVTGHKRVLQSYLVTYENQEEKVRESNLSIDREKIKEYWDRVTVYMNGEQLEETPEDKDYKHAIERFKALVELDHPYLLLPPFGESANCNPEKEILESADREVVECLNKSKLAKGEAKKSKRQ